KPKRLGGRDVRGLGTLWALNDLELHTLTFGQRLVAVHRDRGEVDEDVVATLTLNEPVTLLVREPLDGALLQPVPPTRAPARRPARLTQRANGTRQPPRNASKPRLNRAALSVERRSNAIVIGPTPPGTGVMNPATSATAGSTSPRNPSSVRLMPTSITVAPGFTMSGVTSHGRPTAATRMSARRACS